MSHEPSRIDIRGKDGRLVGRRYENDPIQGICDTLRETLPADLIPDLPDTRPAPEEPRKVSAALLATIAGALVLAASGVFFVAAWLLRDDSPRPSAAKKEVPKIKLAIPDDSPIVTFSIDTEPTGAHVSFVPLGMDGEPVFSEARKLGTAPIKAEIEAAHYLVVAQFPDGRFNEVYRTVPVDMNEARHRGLGRHVFWSVENDVAKLPPVEIEHFRATGFTRNGNVWIADRLVTLDAFVHGKRLVRNRIASRDGSKTKVNFESALAFAERHGARIGTASELASVRGDVAEWTATWDQGKLRPNNTGWFHMLTGPIPRQLKASVADKSTLPRHAENVSLGFRLVRSVKPRLTP